MENTKENKLKFFAQYYGQEVCRIFGYDRPVVTAHLSHIDHLELTDLRNITDEDAVELFDGLNPGNSWSTPEKIYDIKMSFQTLFDRDLLEQRQYVFMCDFLRSRGYLIGFHDATPEELISMGWAKFKKK